MWTFLLKKTSLTIQLSFIIVLFTIFSSGILVATQMYFVSDLATKLFEHPLTVNNAVHEINLMVFKIHYDIERLILATDTVTSQEIPHSLKQLDKKVDKNIKLVKERFLGEQKDVDDLATTLALWRSTRHEIIRLLHTGQKQLALDLNRNQCFKQVNQLEADADDLLNFAHYKALEFQQAAHKLVRESSWWGGGVSLFIILLGIWLIRLEKMLYENEAQLKELQHIAHIGSWEWNVNTQDGLWSDETCHIFGLPIKNHNKLHHILKTAIHSDDKNQVQHLIDQAIHHTGFYRADFRIIRPNHEIRYVQSHGKLVHDLKGKPITLFGIIQDITERKRVEEALEKSRAQLVEAQRIAHLGHWEWNLLTGEEYWSDEMFRLLDLLPQQDEFTHETFESAIYPEEYDLVINTLERAIIMGVRYEIEFRIISRNGAIRYVQAFGEFVRDPRGRPLRLIGTLQDMTEHKQVEIALRKSEERFELAMRGANDGLWDIDFETEKIYLSPRWKKILGFKDKELVNQLDVALERIHPEDLEHVLENITAYLEKRIATYEVNFRMRHQAGHYVWILARGIALWNEQGQVIRFTGTHVDLTAQKQIEEDLRTSEARYRGIVEDQTEFICRFLPDTTLTFVNEAYCRYFGVQAEAVLKQKFLNLVPPETHQAILGYIQYLMMRPSPSVSFTYEHQSKMADGSLKWQQWTDRPIYNKQGRIIEFQSVGHDITARKQAEYQLQEVLTELEQFKNTLDMTLDGIFMFDAETFQYFYVNQGGLNLLGYSREELLQKTPLESILHLTSGDVSRKLDKLLTGSQPSITFEAISRHKNSSLIPTEISLQYIPMNEQEGRFIAIMRDITERKRNESVLRQAKEAAEAANRAKSAFLTNMSHELRTPLNSILGYVQILMRDKELNEKQQQRIEIVYRSGNYLLTLINDILDISKIEAGRIEICAVPFNFNKFLQEIIELFRMRAEQKGIVFIYKPLSYLPIAVNADEKRLRQILINLLGNALKFTEKGGVTFKVGYHDNRIRFQVEDTGIGIAVEELERIFLPFQQIEEQLSKTEGTGLGLTISKALVETMGSKLHVESELGRGSTFWTALDLPEVEHWIEKERTQQPTIIGFKPPSQKILLIDDKWENRSVLVSLLAELGFTLEEAVHGQEALDKLPHFQPHLILADLVMPVMDGFEFIRQLRRLPQFKKIPVIAVSASAFDFQKQRSFEAGFDEFMTKPIHVEELLKSLQQFLQLEWIYESSIASTPVKPPEVTSTTELMAPIKLPAKQAALLLEPYGVIFGAFCNKSNNLNKLIQNFLILLTKFVKRRNVLTMGKFAN
ncbi:MAG: hypothetical protein BWK79_17475 [Beggiatoa sp. IS2]|nr:MAG: hypothetical protein BWK79_17475 [Beggiatoa sp. IS2]